MPKVTFVNEQITVECQAGANLLELAQQNNVEVFRGIFAGFHCKRVKGWCNRCKLWATPLAEGAVNAKTSSEKRSLFRINGALPVGGTMRLACQVQVLGDVEVRTRAGFVTPETTTWDADNKPSKWKDRLEKARAGGGGGEEEEEAADGEAKPAKKAVVKPVAKPAPAAAPATAAAAPAVAAPAVAAPAVAAPAVVAEVAAPAVPLTDVATAPLPAAGPTTEAPAAVAVADEPKAS